MPQPRAQVPFHPRVFIMMLQLNFISFQGNSTYFLATYQVCSQSTVPFQIPSCDFSHIFSKYVLPLDFCCTGYLVFLYWLSIAITEIKKKKFKFKFMPKATFQSSVFNVRQSLFLQFVPLIHSDDSGKMHYPMFY